MSTRVYLSGNEEHDRVLRAFYEGAPQPKALANLSEYQPSDVAVIFGVRKKHVPISWPRGEVFQRQRKSNLNVVVLETGYVNRGGGENHHYAVGFNGLNGRADFRNKDMPDDRAKLLGVELKPWRERGEHIVLCGQIPWDASVDHTDHLRWLFETARQLREKTSRPIRFRPHPLGSQYLIPGTLASEHRQFEHDLHNAHAVFTFNSNSAVEAQLAGVPTFADDYGSMAWDVSAHDLDALEAMPQPDRAPWLSNLAYAQWTPEEMRTGLTWGHLFRE